MRKSFAELRAEVAALIQDNTTNLIEPADVRAVFLDILDAIQPAYGYLAKDAAGAQTLGLTPIPMTWASALDSDPNQTTSNFTAGTIARAERGTSQLTFNADIEAANGRFVTFTIYKDGAPTPWRVTGNGGGAGNPVAVSMEAIDYADPAATYSIYASCEVNGTSVTISNAVCLLSVVPVNTF
jgi:hypothetical protein